MSRETWKGHELIIQQITPQIVFFWDVNLPRHFRSRVKDTILQTFPVEKAGQLGPYDQGTGLLLKNRIAVFRVLVDETHEGYSIVVHVESANSPPERSFIWFLLNNSGYTLLSPRHNHPPRQR